MISRRLISAALASAILAAAAASPAHAEGFDAGSLEGIGLAALYAIPSATCLLTTTVNGAHLAYDEGAPRVWRTTGYVAGGVDLAVGAGVLIWGDDSTTTTVIGIVPLVLGAAAITTAALVKRPDDIVGGVAGVAPIIYADGGGGLVLGGVF